MHLVRFCACCTLTCLCSHLFVLRSVLDNTGGLDALTPGLNSWTLEEIVHASGWRWREVNNSGILVALRSNWDCDFDKTSASQCIPTIQFLRLDDPNSKLSSGSVLRSPHCRAAPARKGESRARDLGHRERMKGSSVVACDALCGFVSDRCFV